ncbi:hypothetical protein SAMN05443545_10873 [Aidingimonas halophila]|uniref:Uncharacterized protein n=1 Tax=Aidingimonas halophila TaxID=574349 RepID=A0A1H3FLY2_9GAMM|nr:hypothetical protein SAMN05443545_10873 [Aidingimonas halophila]
MPIPAGAGLNREIQTYEQEQAADPRRRGAQPAQAVAKMIDPPRSPQARGSTELLTIAINQRSPIPAGAGLNRLQRPEALDYYADPRRRGAQPLNVDDTP